MFDILFEDVGFAVFVISAIAVLAALAVWIYASVTSFALVAVAALLAVACLGGLFKHLFDATLGHDPL